ncbi:hypothetical protein J6590_017287 [Homalodisca vitripennis]|nr:hypothetical protein J6590_017287 [Homalodisca vitripennis]
MYRPPREDIYIFESPRAPIGRIRHCALISVLCCRHRCRGHAGCVIDLRNELCSGHRAVNNID